MTRNSSSEWLDLSEAADLLGVHFTTLRRWADSRQIEFIRTPGKRRKFQRKALEDFINQHKHLATAHKDLLALEDKALARSRQSLQLMKISEQSWYLQMSDEQRSELRGAGNRLIALMMQYSSREDNGAIFLEEARRVTRAYGTICFEAGVSITDCLRIYLLFRRRILDAVNETNTLAGMSNQESLRLYQKSNYFLDETLIAMFDQYSSQTTHIENHTGDPCS